MCKKNVYKVEWYRGKSKQGLLGKIELSISPQLAKIGPRLNPYYRQDYSLNHLCVSLPTRDSSHQLFSLSFPCATEQTFKAQLLCKCQVKNDENNTFVHVFDWIYVVWCHTLVSWFVSLKYNFEGLLLHRIGENIIWDISSGPWILVCRPVESHHQDLFQRRKEEAGGGGPCVAVVTVWCNGERGSYLSCYNNQRPRPLPPSQKPPTLFPPLSYTTYTCYHGPLYLCGLAKSTYNFP